MPSLRPARLISAINVSTADNARSALASIDAALSQVSGARASLGATQNRFQSVVSSLQTTAENLSASRSRILDADFAAETASHDQGPDPAAGRYGDGRAGELGPAERAVTAARLMSDR